MKSKNILIIIAIIVIIAFIGLTLYKFNFKNIKDKPVFATYEIADNKKNYNWPDEKDNELYKEYIITENRKKINYEFSYGNEKIVGEIYIDDEGFLHITETNEKNDKLLLPAVKFKTMFAREDMQSIGMIWVYLISEDNDLSYLTLRSNNINEVSVIKIDTKYPVTNFTNLNYYNDSPPSRNTFFVLEEDGNIYEIMSGYRYIPNVKFLFESIAVFDDNTMANPYGLMLQDRNGNNYKIKYIFNTSSKNKDKLFGEDAQIIITEDDQLFAINSYTHISIANSKVKTIKFDKRLPFESGALYIELENYAEFNFDAYCSTYYCVNEFDY